MANRLSIRHRIVLVPFPFDDLSGVKVRTALCLTEPFGKHRHVILAFITGNCEGREPTDILLSENSEGFVATGLRKSSLLRLHRLTTVTTRIILRELGSLHPDQTRVVNDTLVRLFGIR